MNAIDKDFIDKTEASHFRTDKDTGANQNALFVWNLVRDHVGLSKLKMGDLPAFCVKHDTYHVIREDYECKREKHD